jgi:hypothetical protein
MAAATGPESFTDGDMSDTKVSVIDAFSKYWGKYTASAG